MQKRMIGIVGGVAGLMLSLTACIGDTKASSPDPTSDKIQMIAPAQVIGMPQGFRNLAIVCDKFGNLWGVTSRGSDISGGPQGGGMASGVAVIPNSPACKH